MGAPDPAFACRGAPARIRSRQSAPQLIAPKMNLESFRIRNFRSVNDSGEIHVSRITALLGRNESGKSNLLLALKSLNPIEGFKALNKIKDFPRHRRLEECTDKTEVVETKWTITDEERAQLVKILPRARTVTAINIGRRYGEPRWIGFEGLTPLGFDASDASGKVRKVSAAVKASADKLEDPGKTALAAAADKFEEALADKTDSEEWAAEAKTACANLRKALATQDSELSDKQDQMLTGLEDLAKSIGGDDDAQSKARTWAVEQLPIFIYLDEYPDLDGHQRLNEFLTRKNRGQMTEGDTNFEKMCKVAGLRPDELKQLLDQGEQETRNQLANRASAVVTSEMKRLWKDRPLKIRFSLDADYFDTLISDPNATFDVEVNLNERSRGFKWFFSFYMTFAADTKGGKAEKAILLLDEPGLYLHAKSQLDLLTHLQKDFKNQILFTTHSPFLVPTHNLDWVRTVRISEETGTTVTNDPSGDSRTLFPLQAALGYDLSQTLFIGPHNLVVEGVTDYWILSSISDFLRESGKTGLESEITMTPAGGAQKVSYMVALLTSESLNVVVLLDAEKESRLTKDELVKSKLIREENVVFVSEAFGSSVNVEADVEDLIDPATYDSLVAESYAGELKGKTLNLNKSVPRIAVRYQIAFKEAGLEFHKTRPARLFLKKMSANPQAIVTPSVESRCSTLFRIINDRLKKHLAWEGKPFS